MKPFSRYALLLLLLVGCKEMRSSPERDFAPLIATLEPGDLLFRRGTGFAGRVVTSMDRKGEFSHVGVVVWDEGRWLVVHAVPHEPDFKGDFDRVKCESVEQFLGHYADGTFGLFRPQIEPQKRQRVAQGALRLSRKQVPFDHDYDLADTTRLYCTELVEYLFLMEGLSLSEGRRTEITFPSLKGSYILPSDLSECSYLKPIY